MLNTNALPNAPICTNLPQPPPDHYSHVLADRFQVAILDNDIGKMIPYNDLYLKTLLSDPTFTQYDLSDLCTTQKITLQIIQSTANSTTASASLLATLLATLPNSQPSHPPPASFKPPKLH